MTTTKTPDLQGLRQALLTPFEIVRDEQGCFSHPALPLTDEDVSARKFLSAFGIESAFVGMEDDCNDEALLESVGDGGSCAAWSPSTPSGDGWLLLAIYDTEEGPHALFARPAQAVEPTKRRRTAEAEPAPYGLPEFWAEAKAKNLTMADILPGVVKRLAEIEGTAPAVAGPTPPATMPPMNEDLVEILGRPNFTCIRPAQAMRMGGFEIPSKAEHEQAHFIHFLLGKYFLHGSDWAKKSNEALQAMVASAQPKAQS